MDQTLANALKEKKELEKRRLSCWLDRWNLISGNSWQTTIGVALGPGYQRTTP